MNNPELITHIKTLLFNNELIISDDLIEVWYELVKNSFQNKNDLKEFLMNELAKYKDGDEK